MYTIVKDVLPKCGLIEVWSEIPITKRYSNLQESANRQLLYNVRYNASLSV